MLEGKFDQLTRSTPYSAFIQSFQSFIRQLLTESQERLTHWKAKLLAAVGPNGQVLIDIIPELEHIIGPQPAAPDLPPAQTHNRLNFVFQNFVHACAAPDHPLVIFLDDLQWVDLPSLNLLEVFTTDPRTQHILFLGAYRDNEVNDAHPLMLKLKDIQEAGAHVETITLRPLQLRHVEQLLAQMLHGRELIPPTPFSCKEKGAFRSAPAFS
jgi:predicted ATPase